MTILHVFFPQFVETSNYIHTYIQLIMFQAYTNEHEEQCICLLHVQVKMKHIHKFATTIDFNDKEKRKEKRKIIYTLMYVNCFYL